MATAFINHWLVVQNVMWQLQEMQTLLVERPKEINREIKTINLQKEIINNMYKENTREFSTEQK